MSKTRLHELHSLGQSIWLDYISRPLLETGALKKWIDDGLAGMTSNPSIFNQSISQSKDYDSEIVRLKAAGKSPFEIYDELTIRDIQQACDQFKPVYEATKGLDGYVSLEINPTIANDTAASIKEGKRLYAKVQRPNVMIKVPSTDAGFPVITELLGEGINVNVTLIFSLKQYEQTAEAFLAGMEKLAQKGGDLKKMASVASFFVSRIDNAADEILQKKGNKELQGKAAVANCQLAFEKFLQIFSSPRFKTLEAKGARVQRLLWASTSTKNPAYSDVKYVEELICQPTVNTLPQKTLEAFADHGKVKIAMSGKEAGAARQILANLKSEGADIDVICAKLLGDGVVAFEKSFNELMASIETKSAQLVAK